MASSGYGSDQRSDDSYADIPQNRTLFTEKLTYETAMVPQVVHGLETMEQVFSYYKPGIEINFEDATGYIRKEKLSFNKIEDFAAQKIAAQSNFLKSILSQKEQYLKMIRHLKSNPDLKAMFADPGKKELLQQALKTMMKELNQHKQ